MSRYAQFFIRSKRLTSQKPLALIDGAKLESFFSELLADNTISTELKLFVFVAASGGLRVTEALSLSKEDFFEQDGCLFFTSKVLKKRKEETRFARVHPSVAEWVKENIKLKVGCLIKKNSSTLYRNLRRLFPPGICNHSLRHSLVSYLLFEKDMSNMKVAKLINIGVKTVEHYAHLDQRKTLKGIF
ncbi:tyrosine-type recombinase/integrase [Bdellovibrio bacteriovorus]|uniref:tyrosine-type recombinase/integrase n=1 Tax=Bdellovibrio bacteriovorus TaxID=959 RepID=UPI003AA872AA